MSKLNPACLVRPSQLAAEQKRRETLSPYGDGFVINQVDSWANIWDIYLSPVGAEKYIKGEISFEEGGGSLKACPRKWAGEADIRFLGNYYEDPMDA